MLLSVQNMSPSTSAPSALSTLTVRQAQVALALAQGATISAAAAAGLNRVTIHRWLDKSEFAEAVSQARAAYILSLHDEKRSQRAQAHATVDALLADPQTPPEERLRLALTILGHKL